MTDERIKEIASQWCLHLDNNAWEDIVGFARELLKREWVSLTDAEMCECYNHPNIGYAIEAKLKEKNNG